MDDNSSPPPKNKAYWSTRKSDKRERKTNSYAGDPDDVQPMPHVQASELDNLD